MGANRIANKVGRKTEASIVAINQVFATPTAARGAGQPKVLASRAYSPTFLALHPLAHTSDTTSTSHIQSNVIQYRIAFDSRRLLSLLLPQLPWSRNARKNRRLRLRTRAFQIGYATCVITGTPVSRSPGCRTQRPVGRRPNAPCSTSPVGSIRARGLRVALTHLFQRSRASRLASTAEPVHIAPRYRNLEGTAVAL